MKIKDIYDLDYVMNDDNLTIFNYLSDEEDYPLLADFINSGNLMTLNIDYYASHSSDKFLSPLITKLMKKWQEQDYRDLISEQVAKIVYNRYGEKWKKIYDALMTKYNPLENYSMTEERTPDLTFEDTETQKSNIETERETSAENKYKGFNSSSPVTINKTDGTENVVTSGSKLDNEVSKTTTHTGTETLTRSGNIGVTISQQMLQSEFEVRKYDFYNMIYNDIDSVLCLSVY